VVVAKKKEASPEVITILNIVNMCEKYSTLPRAGGLLDQDKLFMYVLQYTTMCQNERAELDQAKANAAKR